LRPETEGALLLDQNQSVAVSPSSYNLVNLNNFTLIARSRTGDASFKCLPYQLSMGSIPEREPEKRLPHPRRQQARKLPTPGTGR
ncbi:hypothetical protein TcasGA2_TC034988, partial [Tribolium castaneum]